ncbi:MAG: leucine-rich repeat protein [Treponema sp.]|nr:leucine-rich repeat protein [Treponema sp.]
MKTSFSLKNAVFSCAVCLALFSCSNFESGPASDAFSLPEREGSGSQAALTRTVRGSAELSGIYPSGFGANVSASQEAADGVSKTIFPASDSVNAYTLEYFVTASHEGMADIEGTVAVKFGIPTYEITLPFSSSDDEWSVTIIGKNASGKILVSSGAVAVKYGDAEKDIPLSYSQDPDGDTGSIEFRIQLESGTGVQSVSWSIGTYTVDPYDFSGGTTYVQKTDLAPGTYAVKVLFYSGTSGGGDVIYVINEIANVYSNLKTSALYGKADYASGGRAYVTTGLVSAMQNVGQNGVFLGGTGPSGIAASDDNSGTVFKPVATLQRAVEIANALAATDASKTYTINVKGDVFAGTSTKPTAQIATGAKVAIKGDGTSIRKIKGSSGSFSLTSSGADVLVQNIDFDEMGAILVSSGKVTMNDCKVQNGISSGSETAGGITVVAGSQFVSEQGLKITSCKNTAYNGGGIYCLGTLSLAGTEISACSAKTFGGGIYLEGSGESTLSGVKISGNSLTNSDAGKGGGIYIDGSSCVCNITDSSELSANEIKGSGSGAYVNAGELNITNSSVTGNKNTEAYGGGISVIGDGILNLNAVTFSANTATSGGKAIFSSGTTKLSGACVFGSETDAQDIYLPVADKPIVIAGSLPASSPAIMLSPAVSLYVEGQQVLALDSSSTTLPAEAGKFCVKPKSSQSWGVDNAGLLAKGMSASEAISAISGMSGSGNELKIVGPITTSELSQLAANMTTAYQTDTSRTIRIKLDMSSAAISAFPPQVFDAVSSLDEVVLPEGLTAIPSLLFARCDHLRKVNIPSTVTSINAGAFSACPADIELAAGNTNFTKTGDAIYSNDGKTLILYCAKQSDAAFEIPATVEEIGAYAFSSSNGKAITFQTGSALKTIGSYAFYNCNSIANAVSIPNAVTSIGEWAFAGCRSLVSITLPPSVTSISSALFLYDTKLASIVIPDGATQIPSNTFGYCTALKTITLPASLSEIKNNAFVNVNLTTVNYKGTEAQKSSIVIGDTGNGNIATITWNCNYDGD